MCGVSLSDQILRFTRTVCFIPFVPSIPLSTEIPLLTNFLFKELHKHEQDKMEKNTGATSLPATAGVAAMSNDPVPHCGEVRATPGGWVLGPGHPTSISNIVRWEV